MWFFSYFSDFSLTFTRKYGILFSIRRKHYDKSRKKRKNIRRSIKNLMSVAKQDYVRMSTMGGKEWLYSKEQVDN